MERGTVIVNNLQIQNPDGSVTEMVFVDDENGKGYSMLKSTYEAQQVEHLTEIPTEGDS